MSGCRTVARTLGSAINKPTAAAVHSAFTVSADMLLFALADKIAVFSEKIAAGHTYISCHFGEVDVFGNAGHHGTDIPAPEGGHTYLGCPQRHGAGQWLERQLRQLGAVG